MIADKLLLQAVILAGVEGLLYGGQDLVDLLGHDQVVFIDDPRHVIGEFQDQLLALSRVIIVDAGAADVHQDGIAGLLRRGGRSNGDVRADLGGRLDFLGGTGRLGVGFDGPGGRGDLRERRDLDLLQAFGTAAERKRHQNGKQQG